MNILNKVFGNKKVIYTACFGNYDDSHKGADIIFNEDNNPFSGSSEHLSDRLMAKFYKVVNPYNYDIWIDSSVEMIDRKGLMKILGGDFCVFKHPFNKSIKDELELCHKIGYVDNLQKENIENLYKSANMDIEKTPVYSCGFIFRRGDMQQVNDLWWRLICQYSYRDQLTFPYVVNAFESKVDFRILDLDIFDNQYFKVNNHKS